VLIGYAEWLDRQADSQALSPAAARVLCRALNGRRIAQTRDDLSTPEEIAAARQLIRAGATQPPRLNAETHCAL
jgi:hypothetical protein